MTDFSSCHQRKESTLLYHISLHHQEESTLNLIFSRTSRMDAAIHAMKQFGFDDESVIAKMRELLKEHGGQYGFIDIYSVLLEALLSNQDMESCKEENQEAAHGETSIANEIVEGDMVEGHSAIPTTGFTDILVCSSSPLAAIPPPSPQQVVVSLLPSTPVVDVALLLPLPASPPVVDAPLPLSPPPPPVMDAALQLPPPPVLDADRPLPPPPPPVMDAALQLPPPPILDADRPLPLPPPVMDAASQLPPPPVLDVDRPLPPPSPPPPAMDAALQLLPPPVLDADRPPPPPPVMDAALQLPPPPVLDADGPLPPPTPVTYSTIPPPGFGPQYKKQKPCYGSEDDKEPQLIRLPSLLDGKVLPPETPSSQQGLEELSDGRKDCPRPRSRWDFRSEGSSRSVTRNQSHHPVPSSRYESQKRRDWNTFDKYLKNQSPPVTVSQCNCSHVLEFLQYLDQFGKTKVHLHGCVYFGQLYPLDSPCTCPLRQAWGSLDSMTGRLRAAYEENVGASEKNPFGNKAIQVYLRQVKECQAKARGVSYEKKKKKNKIKASDEANASKLQAT